MEYIERAISLLVLCIRIPGLDSISRIPYHIPNCFLIPTALKGGRISFNKNQWLSIFGGGGGEMARTIGICFFSPHCQ